MILQALLAFAERESLGDADFETVGVRWMIPLDAKGLLAGGPVPLSDDSAAPKPPPRSLLRPFTSPNELTQTGDKARSYFLCDTLERAVLFLDPKTPEKHENRRAQHRYFRELLTASGTSSPASRRLSDAVISFLDNTGALANLHAQLAAAKARPADNATFSVDGTDLLAVPELKDFWRERRRQESARAAAERDTRVCIATGVPAPTLDTTEKIKGVPGGLAQGTNLISFDKASFRSYGLEQAQNAPLSAVAELKIRSSLNHLVQQSRDQRLVFNDTVYLHWTREPLPEDPIDLLATADPEGVRNLLDSVRAGERQVGLDANAYYCLGLSGNGARVVVRDWLDTTAASVQAAVAGWFLDSEVIDSDGISLRSGHKFGAILYSLVRKELEELPPALPAALFYAILRGRPVPLPSSCLSAALRRQVLDQRKPDDPRDPRLNPARLGLIRAVLNRLPHQPIIMKAQLDPACSDAAYLCGRLFAVFDRLQYLAQGQLNAGIGERFYASASVTPSLVMGRLFRNAQFHLAKAGGGIAENVRKDFESISIALGAEFPPTLSLEQQGRFALGFYHQKADYRRISAENRAERGAEASAAS